MDVKKVLIIEDETELRETLGEMLHYEGFSVVKASDGREGLFLSENENPDIILCDIRMPEMDGYDLLKTFRQQEAFQRIPFIFLTALTEREKFRQGMELGADDFLTKPFTREELIGAVAAQMEKYQKREEYIRQKIDETEAEIAHKLTEVQNDLDYQQQNIDRMVKEKDELYSRLKEKELNGTAEALHAIETSNTILNIKNMIATAMQNPDLTPRQKKVFSHLKNKINEKKLLSSNWTIFQLRFNQAYPDFIPRLTQKYKKLTQYELVFISATRMGLSTDQLSDLFNISAGSVRKSRYRIKKKMGLKPEEDFLRFIHSIND